MLKEFYGNKLELPQFSNFVALKKVAFLSQSSVEIFQKFFAHFYRNQKSCSASNTEGREQVFTIKKSQSLKRKITSR